MTFVKWKRVKTFDDLVRVNAAFVRGDLKRSPYHAGPLMPDSLPLVPNLLALHRLGLVTTSGQSNECKYCQPTRRGDRYFDSEQKPYIEFTMLKTEAGTKLIHELMNSDKFIIKVTDGVTDEVKTNMPIDKYNVTRDRSAEALDKLVETPWREFTNLWRIHPGLLEHDWPDHIVDFLRDTAVSVDVAMKEYGKGDLEKELLDICQAVGMQPIIDIAE